MINILDKQNCCGCESCVQICPKQCISFTIDEEGFYYPRVNHQGCISCGLCEKVCPVINPYNAKRPINAYAAFNKNEEIRLQSSSGGIFTLLAEKIIEEKGVVFGAKFDSEWKVIFAANETIDNVGEFRGSKYSQARVGDSFLLCKDYLNKNRKVLFTGTPCQIAGLKHFLQKDYENLITSDVVCHGVPSPGVFDNYLKEISKDKDESILSIDFRNKTSGWKNYSVAIKTQKKDLIKPYRDNAFMKAFLYDLILRPSCYKCVFKEGRSHSDITMADFWGVGNIHPEMDDDKGTTLLVINTTKGVELLKSIDDLCVKIETSLADAISYNPAYLKPATLSSRREKFFKNINDGESTIQLIEKLTGQKVINKIIKKIKRVVVKTFKLH